MYFKKIKFLKSLIFIFCFTASNAQNLTVNSSIVSCTDNTYVTFGQGLGNQVTEYGLKRLNPLIFEAQLAPLFVLQFNKKMPFGFILSPKILVRMFNEPSSPVRTPSYMPFFMIYHRVKFPFLNRYNAFKLFLKQKPVFYMSYKYGHHSNGQFGQYFLPNSRNVNFVDGNFSTDYNEIATSFISKDTINDNLGLLSGRFSFEFQLSVNREDSMFNSYYFQKFALEARLLILKKITIVPVVSIMFGKNGFKTKYALDTYIIFQPFPKKSDLALFSKIYIGPDYYNLRYVNNTRFISFGILLEPKGLAIYK